MVELFLAILAVIIIAVVLVLLNRCPKGGWHDDSDARLVRWSLYEFKCAKCGKTVRFALW